MVQIGGHEATLLDFEIPARYGLRQTIADTLGIGGIFRTLRTARPHARARARDGRALPPAWLLNYTNPMAMLCWLVYGGTPTQNVVGLCHSVQLTTEDLAELVGVPLEEVTFLAAGLNHQAFILRFERDGEDLYPRLDERIASDPELQRRVRVQLYRRLRLLPDRVERARGRVRALVHAPRRPRSSATGSRSDEYIRRSEENLVEYERVKGVARTRRDRDPGALERVCRRRSSTRWKPGNRA